MSNLGATSGYIMDLEPHQRTSGVGPIYENGRGLTSVSKSTPKECHTSTAPNLEMFSELRLKNAESILSMNGKASAPTDV